METYSPLTHPQPPDLLAALQAKYVAIGKPSDGGKDSFTILTTQSAEIFECRRADIDPPRPRAQPNSSRRACSSGIPGAPSASMSSARSSSV